MKASILIPAYNAAEFIGDTLASCVQQGRDCIEEIIVINDQSEDDTRGVVERFQVEHADSRSSSKTTQPKAPVRPGTTR